MPFICKCGSKEFERALEPVTKPLQQGVIPPPGKFYLRCSNQHCQRPITEALELKGECPECKGMEFIEPITLDGVITLKCANCGNICGNDQLEELAVCKAWHEGFIR